MIQYKPPFKSKDALRTLYVSDIHLAHPAINIYHHLDSLSAGPFSEISIADADVIFVPGDLFDRLIQLPNNQVSAIERWFINIFRLCKQYNTALRVLEGTPSHDWRQAKTILELNNILEIDADIKYFDELVIDDDTELGLTVGYIPDQIRENYEITTKAFRDLMVTKGYDKVDIIISHGFCDFQLPPQVKTPTFDSKLFSKWFRYIMANGHDHIHKSYGNIVVPSSFERSKCGEEQPKGFILADIEDGSCNWQFIPNPNALRFDTLYLANLSDEDAKSIIDARVTELSIKRLSTLAIELPASSGLTQYIKELDEQLENIKFKIKKLKKKADSTEDITFEQSNVVNITPDNVIDVVLSEIAARNDIFDNESVLKELEYLRSTTKCQ